MPDLPDPDPAGASQPRRDEVVALGASGATARLTRHGDELELEISQAGDGPADADDVTAALAEVEAARHIGERDGTPLRLAAAHGADRLADLPEQVADRAGFVHRRDLLQLRRPLPLPADHPLRSRPALPLRAFRPGTADEEAWVRVNNRAFATHPDQGTQRIDTLHDQMAEPWFDPAGFLVADDPTRADELAGFCWTKVHPATPDDPSLGEIYVIGVDPSHRGEGLGPGFVLAGLDHLAHLGITTAVLYVEADNEPALRLYDALGFTTHARRRVYTP